MSFALMVSSAGLSSAGMAAAVVGASPAAAFVFAVWFVVGVCTHATQSKASAAASDTEERMRIFIGMCLVWVGLEVDEIVSMPKRAASQTRLVWCRFA
jgi:hypothetical protein